MPSPTVPDPIDNAPIFDLCNASEKRFLCDLIEQREPGAPDDPPVPELYALLRAIERMWGSTEAKQLTAPPQLTYYLAVWPSRSQRRKIYGKPVIVYLIAANFPLKTVG